MWFSTSLILSQVQLDSLLNEGLEEAYKFNLKESEQIYESALSLFPESPEPFYKLSKLYLWKYLGSRDQGQYEIYKKYAQLSMNRLEPLIDKDDENLKLLLLMAMLNQDEATALAYNYEPTDAFWPARRSNSYFEDLLDLDECNVNALLGSAIYNYSLSYVPGYLKWILNITGLETDYVLALEKLRQAKVCADKSIPELDFHLGVVYSEYVAEHDSAIVLFERLTDSYPNNIIFRYQSALAKVRNRKLEAARVDLERILLVQEEYFQQTKAFCYFHLAEINFANNNFETALEFYNRFISKTLDINYYGLAGLRMAICYYAIGDNENFKKNLLETKLGNEELLEDKYAMDLSAEYLSNGFSKNDLFVWELRNSLLAGKYDSILEKTNEIGNKKFDVRLSILANLILAEAMLQAGDLEKLEEVVLSLDSEEIQNESLQNYSNLVLSRYNFLQGNIDLAIDYAEDITDSEEYSDLGLTKGEIYRFRNMLYNYKKDKN